MSHVDITGTSGLGYTVADSGSLCFGSKEKQKHVKTILHDPLKSHKCLFPKKGNNGLVHFNEP